MKLDLENDSVFELDTTVTAVRSYFDGKELETVIPGFSDILDEAQGFVFAGQGDEAFIVIRVKA